MKLRATVLCVSLVHAAGIPSPVTLGWTETTAAAQAGTPDISPQMMAMAVRAAQIDAYRQLSARIYGFDLNSSTSVRDFVTSRDEIRVQFEAFIKGVRFTDTRKYSDGSAEVTAEITIQRVIEELKRLHEREYRGKNVSTSDIESISRRTERQVLEVTGTGAVRPDSHVPEIGDVSITDLVLSPSRPRQLPEIYSRYPAQERLKAKRAAEIDAYRQLIERIYGLQLDSDTSVRDFVTERDEIDAEAQAFLRGAQTTAVRYTPDGIVEVEMKVTIQTVVTMLKRIQETHYRGSDEFTAEDVQDVKRSTKRTVITVVGQGALDTGRDRAAHEHWEVIRESDIIIID